MYTLYSTWYCRAQFVVLRNLYGVQDPDYFICNYMQKMNIKYNLYTKSIF